MNREFETLFQGAPAKGIGAPLLELISHSSRDGAAAAFELHTIADDETWLMQLPIAAGDCSPAAIELTVSKLPGDLAGAQILWQISFRRASESQLDEARRATEMLNAVQDQFFTWRLGDGRIENWNKAAQQLYGTPRRRLADRTSITC